MNNNLVEVKGKNFYINLMYFHERNMFRRSFYKELGIDKCFAHRDLAEKLKELDSILEEKGLILEICDCWRPLEVQAMMWEYLPDERYLAPPTRGSKHNKGIAIDCTLRRKSDGKNLSFPTEVDGYKEELIDEFLSGNMKPVIEHLQKASLSYDGDDISQEQKENRDMLRSMMESIGLVSLEEEWWHYELPNVAEYSIIK